MTTTRRSTAHRLLLAIPYLILYIIVLFPLAFGFALIAGAIEAVIRIVTGRSTRLTSYSQTLWDWVGGNARWSLTGSGQWRWTPWT